MAKRSRRRAAGTSDDDGKTTTEPLPPPAIPLALDPFLEILARSDAKTVVRCAATSKAVRQVVLGRDFREHLAMRAETNGGGFDPTLLLGVSYAHTPTKTAVVRGEHVRFDANLLLSYELMDSRDGFVVLQKKRPVPPYPYDDLPTLLKSSYTRPPAAELRVCDTLTGETHRLPPAAIDDYNSYPHVLLLTAAGDGGGRSFQLLAVDGDLRTQTFSSTDGRWGTVLQTLYASQEPYYAPKNYEYISHPIILESNNIIHWLRLPRRYDQQCSGLYPDHLDPHIIALDVASAPQATRIDLLPECLSRMRCTQQPHEGLQLATSPTGKLAVIVAEILTISMWTLSQTDDSSLAPTWIRQVVIKRQVIIDMESDLAKHYTYSIWFLGFGQRSGTVLMIMDEVGLVQLNLGSKDVVILNHEREKRGMQLCLYEINLSSLLQSMIQL